MYEPRPCVIILPERIDYRQNPDYAHCRFGDVTFTPTDFFHALEISKQKHSAYKDAQQKGAREALGEISTASLDRAAAIIADRPEEHTSELQSLMRISYAVFCLKKKKQTQKHIKQIQR